MRIILLKPKKMIPYFHEMNVKIGKKPLKIVPEVYDDVSRLIKRYKKIQISLTPVKGFTRWHLDDWNQSDDICITSPRGKDYYFCKAGLRKVGLSRDPKQNHIWMKLGE